jgi:hypothetical protein
MGLKDLKTQRPKLVNTPTKKETALNVTHKLVTHIVFIAGLAHTREKEITIGEKEFLWKKNIQLCVKQNGRHVN